MLNLTLEDWSIRKKLYAALFAGFIFMLISISAWVMTIRWGVRLSENAIATIETDMIIHEWEIEAHRWISELHKTAHLHKKFERNLNPDQCPFGLWYHSFQSPFTQKEFVEPFKKLGDFHLETHQIIQDILIHLQSGNRKKVLQLVNETLIDKVEKIESVFDQLKRFMDEQQRLSREKLKRVNLLQNVLIGLFFLLWALAFLAVRRYSDYFAGSLTSLSRAARQIARGNLSVSISNEKKRDEIGLLQDSFCIMLANLKKLTGTLSAIAQSSPVALVACDIEGKVNFVSSSAEQLTGHSSSDILGEGIQILMPERYRQKHFDAFRQAVGRKKLVHNARIRKGVELPVLTRSGDEIPCEIFLSEICESEGDLVGFTAAILDLREKKKLTEQSVRQEKMASLGQMAGGIAHEINNPLGVILGFSQSIVSRLSENDPLCVPLRSIEREAKRCKTLVQDLLTFSRIGKVEKEECDLNEVIQGALSIVETYTKVKSIELVKDFDESLPGIPVYRNQIQQMIINLCNNSIDAMPQGGILKIQTRRVVRQLKDYVEIQVQDTGAGIPKEMEQKIFDPFFTTKEVGKGTGLGLSLVHEIVQKHQGNIEVSSEAGIGTVFRILLSFTGESCESVPGNDLILIVEDEPEVMRMIQRMLAHSNLRFIATGNGFEAGKLLAQSGPRLIILDVFLPGMDGFSICKMIHSDDNLKNIKILAISGKEVRDTARKIIGAGANDFLAKPFSPEELKARILKLL